MKRIYILETKTVFKGESSNTCESQRCIKNVLFSTQKQCLRVNLEKYRSNSSQNCCDDVMRSQKGSLIGIVNVTRQAAVEPQSPSSFVCVYVSVYRMSVSFMYTHYKYKLHN